MLRLSSAPAAPPEPEFVLRGHDHAVTALQFLRRLDGPTVLASGDVRGIVRVWDLEQRRPLSTWSAHEDAGILELHELADGPFVL
jgi:WD40 repeat protein